MASKKLKPQKLKEIAIRDLKRDLLFHVPSALIILFYSNAWPYSLIMRLIKKSDTLYAFLKDWQWFFHVPLILFAILLPLLNKYITASKIVISGSENIRIRIAEILNKAVNAKETRFRSMLREKKADSSITNGKIFSKITEPIQQIQILSENLLALFRYVCDSNDIKLTVIICEDNNMVNFVYHSDHEPKVTVEDLKNNNSLAKKVLNERHSRLVSSINEKATDYYKSHSNIQSLYCYPISKSAEVNFILSFSSANEDDLKSDFKDLFDDIISEIENRFVLEWHLNSLKNN